MTGLIYAGMGIVILAEVLLRTYEARLQKLHFDIRAYPFYRRMRNAKGRDPYFIERLGRKNTPIIQTSSEGIRSRIDPNKQLIMVLGCSVAEGAAFQDGDTFPGQLQKMIGEKQYRIINAGVSGYGPFQINRLLHHLIKYKPAIVLVQLLDFMRVPLNAPKIIRGKRRLQFYQGVKRISYLAAFLLKLISRRYVSIRGPYMNRKLDKKVLWEKNKKYLDSMRDLCKKSGAELVLFVWPASEAQKIHNSYFREQVAKYCRENKIYGFDAAKAFSYHRDSELKLKNDAHPSGIANRLAAKIAKEYLLAKKLIVC